MATSLALPLQQHAEYIEHVIRNSKAKSTMEAYQGDWNRFQEWAERHEQPYLPATPAAVLLYMAEMAQTYKVASIERALVSISQAHKAAGFEDPPTRHSTVRKALAGIKREKGTAPTKKAPLLTQDLQKIFMTAEAPDSLLALRDRALLLIGFAGAFRRSELSGLNVEDVTETEEGLEILLRKSKTDQQGKGTKKGIVYGTALCPVVALKRWLQAAQITSGAIFRSIHGTSGCVLDRRMRPASIAKVVKKAARRIGKDADRFSGHSLRRGAITQAKRNGADDGDIMRQSGHKSLAVFRGYIEDASLFENNASARLGL